MRGGKDTRGLLGRRRVLGVTVACRRLRNMIRLRVSREKEKKRHREKKREWGREREGEKFYCLQPCEERRELIKWHGHARESGIQTPLDLSGRS